MLKSRKSRTKLCLFKQRSSLYILLNLNLWIGFGIKTWILLKTFFMHIINDNIFGNAMHVSQASVKYSISYVTDIQGITFVASKFPMWLRKCFANITPSLGVEISNKPSSFDFRRITFVELACTCHCTYSILLLVIICATYWAGYFRSSDLFITAN